VGEKSQVQAALRSAVDNDSIYFLIEVLDDGLYPKILKVGFIRPLRFEATKKPTKLTFNGPSSKTVASSRLELPTFG
jgi:hypothetical protein